MSRDGVVLNPKDKFEMMVFQNATADGHVKAIRGLFSLPRGFIINHKDATGKTALYSAALHGRLGVFASPSRYRELTSLPATRIERRSLLWLATFGVLLAKVRCMLRRSVGKRML
jgi:hypothetical protein